MRWKQSTARQKFASRTEPNVSPSTQVMRTLNQSRIFSPKFMTILTCIVDLTEIMATSTDYEELKYVWTEWHNQVNKTDSTGQV